MDVPIATTVSDDNGSLCLWILLIFLIFFLVIGGGCGCYYYYNKKQHFTNLEQAQSNKKYYNALYTDNILYTQPPGDVKAQEYGNSGQGTRGSFLPLQGIGAQIHMLNSSKDNYVSPVENDGKLISGQPNLEKKNMDTSWIGFNNFGHPFENEPYEFSNSYLLTAANERVCNSGQKCSNLPCQDWWPSLHKDSKGFCVQGSDSMVNCNGNIETCGKDGDDFVISKNEPQWMKVVKNLI